MIKKYTLFVGVTEVNDQLLDAEQVNELKQEYIHDGYDDVKIVPINIEYEYMKMKDELRKSKLNDLEKEVISKGILMYEKEWKKAIVKDNKRIEKNGRISMIGENMPKVMNHDIFIKIGANRSDYAQFIELNKIEE